MNSNVVLIATITAKPTCAPRLLPILKALVEPSRAEPGCLAYVLHSYDSDENTFLFYEVWKSEEDLNAHNESPHFKAAVDQMDGIAASVKIERLGFVEDN